MEIESIVLHYPPGAIRLDDGTLKQHRDIARELVEKMREGKDVLLPTYRNECGQLLWWFERIPCRKVSLAAPAKTR